MAEAELINLTTSLLVAFFIKTLEKLLDKVSNHVATSIHNKMIDISSLVKSKFQGDEKKKLFKEFELNPIENRQTMEDSLREISNNDLVFRRSLSNLIAEIQKIPDVEIYMKNICSESGVKGAQIGKISNKSLLHSMENISAKNDVIGPTIEKIE